MAFRIRYIAGNPPREVEEVFEGDPPKDPVEKWRFWIGHSRRMYKCGPMFIPATLGDRVRFFLKRIARKLKTTNEKEGK